MLVCVGIAKYIFEIWSVHVCLWVQYYGNLELLKKVEKVEGISFFILMNVVIDEKYLCFAVGSQMSPWE